MNTHQRVAELLPWYVNGSLDEVEMTLVEQHLLECTTCTDDMASEMGIAQGIQPVEDDTSRLAALVAGQAPAYQELRRRLPVERRRWQKMLFAAGLAASFILAAVSIELWVAAPASDGVFEPMTRSTPALDGAVTHLQFAFHATTPEREIRRLLLTSGGRLLGNPSATGVYRVAIAGSDAQEVFTYLSQQPAIRWIELER